VESGYYSVGQSVCLWVKDSGVGFCLLKQHKRLFEARSEDAVTPHRRQQNEQIVAHQRIYPEHQYLRNSSSAFHQHQPRISSSDANLLHQSVVRDTEKHL